MANLFSIYFTDVQIRKNAELLNLSYIWLSHQHHLYPSCFNWLLDPSSVGTLVISQCLPAPLLCLLNVLLHV